MNILNSMAVLIEHLKVLEGTTVPRDIMDFSSVTDEDGFVFEDRDDYDLREGIPANIVGGGWIERKSDVLCTVAAWSRDELLLTLESLGYESNFELRREQFKAALAAIQPF